MREVGVRWSRGVGAGVLALGLAAAVTGCGTPITATALAAQVGPAFARLYAEQSRLLDRPAPPRGPTGTARCGRGGRVSGGRGAGEDWTCSVVFPFPDGHLQPITYDVGVAATGCYHAEGPGAVVGRATLQTPEGRTVTNPLFAFDGCLDVG